MSTNEEGLFRNVLYINDYARYIAIKKIELDALYDLRGYYKNCADEYYSAYQRAEGSINNEYLKLEMVANKKMVIIDRRILTAKAELYEIEIKYQKDIDNWVDREYTSNKN